MELTSPPNGTKEHPPPGPVAGDTAATYLEDDTLVGGFPKNTDDIVSAHKTLRSVADVGKFVQGHGWAKGAPFRMITFWVDWANGSNAAAIHAEWSVRERTADELDDTTVTTTACEIVRLPTSTLTVVVQVRALIQRMVSHEVDECLLVENRRLFDPHKPKHPNLRKL